MDDIDALRLKLFPEDSSLAPSSAEHIDVEDDHYVALRGELDSDARDLEADSWSVAVDQSYLKALHKDAVKRQDVIYELIQTEMHHVRTLKILLQVFMYELIESVQLEDAKLDRLFPCVDTLLVLHQHLLLCLKQLRQQGEEQDCPNNYQITHLGPTLITQFSGELGERMMESYSVFCSHQSDAVSLYKEQMQTNKRFQSIIKKIGQLSIVRRLGFPECILLVTQRITKYPVLVERIIQHTEGGTEEHESLVQALALIRDTISQVDAQVSDYEKAVRLREIAVRLEPKSQDQLMDGRLFRREDLLQGARVLLHEDTLTWKAASGRLKDIHAVLLSDVLLLLQEKDQKLVFAAVDNKPSVISLQRMIVREVAHEDKAMFLICASPTLPVMYEIHSSSREGRDTWMALIRAAVDSCPEGKDELYGEQETRAARFQDFQERVMERDTQIMQSLTEKLQLYAFFARTVTGAEVSHSRLLLRGDATDLQQGEALLKGAIEEVESLQNLLLSGMRPPNSSEEESEGSGTMLRRVQTFQGFDSNPTATPVNNGGVDESPDGGEGRPLDSGHRSSSDPQLQDPDLSETLELSAYDEMPVSCLNSTSSSCFPDVEFFDRVLMLSQRLYSLQAVIAQQDSQLELQRALLAEREQPFRSRGNVLLEREKQRNLEKQREELANFHRLQAQQQQEQQRWERARERQRAHAEDVEAQLLQREEGCRRLEERLAEERAELERLRATYQQDLERLREATQSVAKEKDRLEQQQKLKKHKSFLSQGHFSHDNASQFHQVAHSQSFRVDVRGSERGDRILSPKANVWLGVPASATNEVPPMVPPRKESISPQPTKAEVPIHLISTTNQAHKPGAVQQQIPTKLAASSKGKEKSFKHKSSHQRTHSAASIDMSQVVPIRVAPKEGGSLRAKRTASPQSIQDRFNPPGAVDSGVRSAPSFSTHRRASDGPPPEPPPFPKDVLKTDKERVIFL